ncbi:uncharacterized protein TRAVEDRAFT_118467 [Trametes versicolor FP-101664 SS1]|uniref:uncharacterized protein n=1 Tax=Trametes versicolor (strain FP-101664) TaxID=717944 RepID=UPI0004621F5C|nr:uncharacterized protein TRAVEDRAFT_118467 [Trametes versicolor FP-101664 SS1]EIW61106.1 hypothetical protein TRAVEDRAFT_118467 [Trametes versicolor FP-101664 SS1]
MSACSFVDFAQSASPEGQRSLQELEAACEAAPFGRKQETIIDETYRKAGKMDSRNFMTRFHAEQTGIVDMIRTGLLTGSSEEEGISAQLYKLNVYGKGAFFKPHVDTPHSQKMFGSLVIVFPTPHEGGQLILRKENSEWTFDAARLLSGSADRIAYVAFFSDVEHEVLPVLSGHRVTITYNLYFDNAQSRPKVPKGLAVTQPLHASSGAIKESLRAFLRSPKILPDGGTIGFGLRHVYALPTVWDDGDPEPLRAIGQGLKGSDAALYRACKELGLAPRLRLITENFDDPIMLDHINCLGHVGEEDETAILLDAGGVFIKDAEFPGDDENDEGEGVGHRKLPVHWVTELNGLNRTSQAYLSYGNEASMGYMYVFVCLIADVGKHSDRIVGLSMVDEGVAEGEGGAQPSGTNEAVPGA